MNNWDEYWEEVERREREEKEEKRKEAEADRILDEMRGK